jgi:hypothetical protein
MGEALIATPGSSGRAVFLRPDGFGLHPTQFMED